MVLGGQGVAGRGRSELRDRADLAGLQVPDELLLLAVEAEELADALVLAALGVPDVGLAAERAGEDAEVGEAADEGVGGGLEDPHEERSCRVGGDLERIARPRLVRRRRGLLGGRRQVADDGVEQAAHADPLGRAGHEDRRQERVAHAPVEAGIELGVRDLLALEVLGQDVVVGLGGGLDELVAAGRDLALELGRDRDLDLLLPVPAVGLAVDEIDVAGERLGLADGELQRRDLGAEGIAQGVEDGRGVRVLAVALVDQEEGCRAVRAREGDRVLRARLDPARRVHADDRRVDRLEARHDLGHEVRVARRVNDRDEVAVVVQRGDRERERHAPLLLLGLEVEGGRAVLDATLARDRPGPEEEGLGERRLPGSGVAGEDDAAEVGGVDALRGHRCDGTSWGGRNARGGRRRAGPCGAGDQVGPGVLSMIVRYTRARCPVTPSGPRSSARRASTTSSVAPSSRRWGGRSRWRPGRAAAIRTATSAFASRSRRRAPSTCRRTRSSAPSRRRPVAATPCSSRRSCTRATAPVAWLSWSRLRPTTGTASSRRSARSSRRPAASWPARVPSPGSSSSAA